MTYKIESTTFDESLIPLIEKEDYSISPSWLEVISHPWDACQAYLSALSNRIRPLNKGHGRLEYTNGDIYAGELVNNKPHGRGILECANGDVYEGQFFYGMRYGQGTNDKINLFSKKETHLSSASWEESISPLWHACQAYLSSLKNQLLSNNKGVGRHKYPNGDIYEGELIDGKRHGRGIYKFVSGNVYEGEFVDGKRHGQGIYKFADGSIYEGEFVDDKRHGQGVLKFADGSIYEGEFVDSKHHGQGIFKFANGAVYEGEFVDSKRHGQGVHKFANGDMYEGEFVKDKYHGLGIFKNANGDSYGGKFLNGELCDGFYVSRSANSDQKIIVQNGRVTNLNRFNIGDFLFFSLLYGLGHVGSGFGYSLGILSDYLLHYFQGNADALSIVTSLLEAYHLAAMTPQLKEETILARLQKKESCLLSYGFQGHSMLLNLIPGKDDDFIDCEIFNSGGGLRPYHTKDEKTGKFQTKKIIRIHKSELSSEKLTQLINYKFSSADEAYHALLDIPGAHCIKPENPIWQAPQAGFNCSIECYFAYLRDKLPLDVYKKMRRDLFQASLIARIEKEKESGEECRKDPRVQHKIRTLGLTAE